MPTTTKLLREIGTDPAFRATQAPYLVLDRDLRIRAANPAYTKATLTTFEDLHGAYIFDAFPDNPATPEAESVSTLSASLQRVLRRSQRDYMNLQRYDVPDPGHDGFAKRVWSPVNTPLRADGRTVGILHHVEDLTDLDNNSELSVTSGQRHQILLSLRQEGQARRDAVREAEQLRDAVRTSGIIGQAKGILVAQRGCTPEEAFTLLVELSQYTNTKLHTVAQTLIDDTIERHRLSGEG